MQRGAPVRGLITRERFDAALFDLDGVLTDTARIHAACWKRLLDGYLEERAARLGEPFVPFDLDTDYRHHVDGKPRKRPGVRIGLRHNCNTEVEPLLMFLAYFEGELKGVRCREAFLVTF